MDLNGKRAIVLGGTSGIGLAVTRQLVEAGARVVAGSRSRERIAEASKSAPGASFVEIDVLDRAALESLFTHHAGFEVLVNAATGGERATGPFLQMDLDGFQGSFRKLWGYTNSVRLGAPQMAPDGAIVLVSGYPARRANPGLSALSAVGNAVEGFVRAIAPEIAPRRINVVSPGVIDTPLITVPEDQRADRLAAMTKNQPIARAGTADEVASAIVYLLQNDFVTGSTIDVDGGALLP
jgi:NAD(P)-dependent dehydrogenase (short-subunit alcohol dehydrogenase family)